MILPLVFGCASGLLMIWDIYSYHVVQAMGKALDTGPPFRFLYDAPWIGFLAINTPACALCFPVFSLFEIPPAPARYALLFPVAVIWWWWLGRRIDMGLLPSRPFRRRWLVSAGFALAAVGVYYATSILFLEDVEWWSGYRVRIGPRLLSTLGPRLWGVAIGVTLTLCAMRATPSRRSGR